MSDITKYQLEYPKQRTKGYWVICTKSYEIDGIEIPKGRMDYYTSTRPIVNSNWRKATQDEVDSKQYHKGSAFNLKNV